MSDLGKRLQKIRKDRDLTQKDLSALAAVPLSTLRGYEQGLRTPRLEILGKLCQALEIRPERLDSNLSEAEPLLVRKLRSHHDDLTDDAKARISEIIDKCIY